MKPEMKIKKLEAELKAEREKHAHYKEEAHIWCRKARELRARMEHYQTIVRDLKLHINNEAPFD